MDAYSNSNNVAWPLFSVNVFCVPVRLQITQAVHLESSSSKVRTFDKLLFNSVHVCVFHCCFSLLIAFGRGCCSSTCFQTPSSSCIIIIIIFSFHYYYFIIFIIIIILLLFFLFIIILSFLFFFFLFTILNYSLFLNCLKDGSGYRDLWLDHGFFIFAFGAFKRFHQLCFKKKKKRLSFFKH